jgi:hypothetical protein
MIVDVVDYSLGGAIDRHRHWSHRELTEQRPASVVTILVPTDTLGSFVNQVKNAYRANGSIHLLRIHGHGNVGTFLHGTMTTESVQANRSLLGRLQECFAPRGQAFLMGCRVGEQMTMLMDLAEIWQVPVTAGIGMQHSIGRATFAFEGRTATGLPNRSVEFDRPGIPRLSR